MIVYAFWLHFPEFWPFRNLKKSIGKLRSSLIKKKKKKNTDMSLFFCKIWSGEGNITIFFFGLMYRKFRNVPIFEDFFLFHPWICPYFLGFRVGKYAFMSSGSPDVIFFCLLVTILPPLPWDPTPGPPPDSQVCH